MGRAEMQRRRNRYLRNEKEKNNTCVAGSEVVKWVDLIYSTTVHIQNIS